jgi:hypothetical protein
MSYWIVHKLHLKQNGAFYTNERLLVFQLIPALLTIVYLQPTVKKKH